MSGPYASQGSLVGAKTLGTSRPISKARKAKKMKLTLRQKLRNWLMNDNDHYSNEVVMQVEESRGLNSEGMRFDLFKASGGYIVETRYYDSKTDRNHNKLHIIKDDQDIGEAMGKIITMESLR
jgi:hypothetical protein